MDALIRAVNAPLAFRLVLALPAIIMLSRFALSGGGLGHVLQASGEWAARLLIVTLAVTPIRMIFKGHHWPMWLFKRRRDLGLAAFIYALLHLAIYVVRQSSIHVVLYDLQYKEYFTGWLALAIMLMLTLISNDWLLHSLGLWWKRLQRAAYLAALAVFLHWIWMKLDDTPALAHFVPLVLLEAWRLWYRFARPGAHRGEGSP